MKFKKIFSLTLSAFVVSVSVWAQSISPSTKYHFQEGTIVIVPSVLLVSSMSWALPLPSYPPSVWLLSAWV